jgi:hypothetical protein
MRRLPHPRCTGGHRSRAARRDRWAVVPGQRFAARPARRRRARSLNPTDDEERRSRAGHIAIEGPIGRQDDVARLLAARIGAELMPGAAGENPFLARFYDDRVGYAFQTQPTLFRASVARALAQPAASRRPSSATSCSPDALFRASI